MKISIFTTITLVCLLSCNATTKDYLSFPSGATPEEIGKKLGTHFVHAPHFLHGDKWIHYAEVCTWLGALRFAEATGDKELTEQLQARFEPLFSTEKAYQPIMNHVDLNMFGCLPLEFYKITNDKRYFDLGMPYADTQWTLPGDTPDVPFFWGRGNGWMAAGMTELLRTLPENNPDRPRILNGYLTMMESLKKYQSQSGMWNQLIDASEFWPETSGTAMFTYAILSGIRRGWLNKEEYGPVAHKAWLAIVSYIDERGDVTEVCVGTNKLNDRQYYYDRPRIAGDYHGQAPVLWCAAALLERDLPRFAVISDTHIDNKASKAPIALKNIFSHGDLDAIFVVGDLTDNGRDAQFAEVNATFTNPENVPPGVGVYYMMGNHDNYSNYDSNNQLDSSRPSTNAYLTRLGQPLHQYIEIKGYPFITVSMTDKGEFDAAARQFLTEKLEYAAAKYPQKPIFVFYHKPPRNTCYGSRDEDGWGSGGIPPLLNNYPQVIVFSGHSHYPLGDPRSIHQGNYTAINDGSTIYSEIEKNVVDEGIHPDKNGYVAEGIIVNVLPGSGNVEMERWDTYRNEEILPRWTVKAPFDGSNFATEYANRTGLPAPVFASGDKLIVKKENENYTFTFPAASETADDVVHRYILEIQDNQQQIIKTLKRFSGYYLNSEKPVEYTFSVAQTEIPVNQTLKAQVKAIDAYGNQSVSLVSTPFVNKSY